MRFLCFGYIADGKWESMSQEVQDQMVNECLAYDDELRAKGHFAGGEALQSARTAVTLRWQNGTVNVTDGPYAETKEQIGGILILEADNMDHAVRLMSKHPGVRWGGPFEIRPADEEFIKVIAARTAAASV